MAHMPRVSEFALFMHARMTMMKQKEPRVADGSGGEVVVDHTGTDVATDVATDVDEEPARLTNGTTVESESEPSSSVEECGGVGVAEEEDPEAVRAAVEAVTTAYAGDFTAFIRDAYALGKTQALVDPAEVMARCRVVAVKDLAPDAIVVLTVHGLYEDMKQYAVVVVDTAGCTWVKLRPQLTLGMLQALMHRDTNLPPSLVKYVYVLDPWCVALAGLLGIPGPHPKFDGVGPDPSTPIIRDKLMLVLLPSKAKPLGDAGGAKAASGGDGPVVKRIRVRKNQVVRDMDVDACMTFVDLFGHVDAGTAGKADPCLGAGAGPGPGPETETETGSVPDHPQPACSIIMVYTEGDVKGTYSVSREYWHLGLNDFVQFDLADLECVSYIEGLATDSAAKLTLATRLQQVLL